MLRSMSVTRERVEDRYNVKIDVPEKEYFEIYEDLDKEAAKDIIKQYVTYHGDDGRFSDANIEWDRGAHIVSITAEMQYFGNDHTEQFTIPAHLDATRRDKNHLEDNNE